MPVELCRNIQLDVKAKLPALSVAMARPRKHRPEEPALTDLPPFARRVKEARERLGLSQIALADRINVSQSAVADWETGKTRPRPEALARLAGALHLGLADLASNLWQMGEAVAARPMSQPEMDSLFGDLLEAVSDAMEPWGRNIRLSLKGRIARQAWRAAGGTDATPPDPERLPDQIANLVDLAKDLTMSVR